MMEVSVIGVPVHTASGHNMGRVIGVVLDATTHGVLHYEVRTTRLPGVGHTHLIAVSQVQSISNEEMIVDDAATPLVAPQLAAST